MNSNTYRAVEVNRDGKFKISTRTIPEPQQGQVLIKVQACGICHSDSLCKDGQWPGLSYPRVPGHEVVGKIVKLGPGVNKDFWKEGDRVGAGWHGGHCFNCDRCRRGDFITCQNAKVTGFSHDGGYAEYFISPWEALVRIPEKLDSAEAAPLLCAGITCFNSMRHSNAKPGDLVVIIGIGGLGHLAIQYAHKMGFRVVAVSSGSDKKDLALKLGADIFVDYKSQDPIAEIHKLGGANLIINTSSAGGDQLGSYHDRALAVNGQVLVLGIVGNINVSTLSMIVKRSGVYGWPSGTAMDSEDTLNFSAHSGVNCMIEKFTIDQVDEAYDRMINAKVKFRSVLVFE